MSNERSVSPETSDDELPFTTRRSKSGPGAAQSSSSPPSNNDDSNTMAAADGVDPTDAVRRRRAATHARLRAYESKRRMAYESKLQSSSLYWHAFRSLMHDSLLETQKADILVRGWTRAAESYGASMASIGEWCIDEKEGAPIVDESKKKKFLERAKAGAAGSGHNERSTTGSGGGSGVGASGAGTATSVVAMGDHYGKKGVPLVMTDFYREENCGSMIYSLADSAASVSDRHAEMTRRMNDEVLPELASLLSHLKSEVVFMERLGDSIMKELESAEEEVCGAWDSYYEGMLDFTSGGGGSSSAGPPSTATTTSEASIVAATPTTTQQKDVWVEEMRYRMAVAFLSTVWAKCSSELSKLFLSMKDAECNRQKHIKELLIKAVQSQERLWVGLPSSVTPVLKELIEWPMEQKTVEDDVQFSIRERAMSIQRDEEEHKLATEEKPLGPGLTGVKETDGNFELSSPLVSDLLHKAKVIEKRGTGMLGSWKVSLAVITRDSFLQLFELPSTSRLHSGSAPEVAFQNLIPPVVVPSMEGTKAGIKLVPAAKSFFDNLVPSESFALPNCVVSLRDENDAKNPNSFEIVETIPTSGASKMFTKTVNRRMQFRAVTREEAEDLVDVLRSGSRSLVPNDNKL